MRGVYTTAGKCAGITAARTLGYLTAPSAAVVELLSLTVTNESNATNFQFEIAVKRITTLGTPSATSVTPSPHEAGDQAAGSTTKINCTSEPTTYGVTIPQEGAASLVGYRWEPLTDLERIYVAPSANIGFYLATTPGASTDFDIRF